MDFFRGSWLRCSALPFSWSRQKKYFSCSSPTAARRNCAPCDGSASEGHSYATAVNTVKSPTLNLTPTIRSTASFTPECIHVLGSVFILRDAASSWCVENALPVASGQAMSLSFAPSPLTAQNSNRLPITHVARHIQGTQNRTARGWEPELCLKLPTKRRLRWKSR